MAIAQMIGGTGQQGRVITVQGGDRFRGSVYVNNQTVIIAQLIARSRPNGKMDLALVVSGRVTDVQPTKTNSGLKFSPRSSRRTRSNSRR